jgi:hypothetical protein
MFKIITAHNNRFKELASYNIPIIKNYCEYYGYSYQIYEIPDDYPRPAAWSKIDYLIQEINNRPNQYTLWIDADAIILRHDIDLWSFIRPEKYLYLSKDNSINTGVFLIKNNGIIKKLLEQAWSMTQYLNHNWWEQAAIIDLVNNNYLSINNYIEYIPRNIFNAHNDCITDSSFIGHFPVPFLEKKIYDVKKYSTKYQYQNIKKYAINNNTEELLNLTQSWMKLNNLCLLTKDKYLISLSEKMYSYLFMKNI